MTITGLYLTRIFGHTDVDTFQLGDATGVAGGTTLGSAGYIHLGGKTRIYGSQTPTAARPDGEDRFLVYYLQTMNVAAGHTLTLDGQDESDTYLVYTTGSRGSSRNYVINVLDTGAPDDGVDSSSIYGADSALQRQRRAGHAVPDRRHLPAPPRLADPDRDRRPARLRRGAPHDPGDRGSGGPGDSCPRTRSTSSGSTTTPRSTAG